MTDDEFIRQMTVGTPPSDRTTNPGILPPEIRQAIDVPLDLANLFVRGTAAVPIGSAYGLYKGITSDKYGTPEGVQEASSEAAKMMARITGEPKTQAGRDVMEFIGKKAEELKLAPTPQLLTAPLPGPGSASALMRNYELAETPPGGAINVSGAKAQVTPPKNEMGFFSPTEQVVMNLPQEKGTAQQMLAQISKAPGAKAAELRATGLEEFLKGKGTAPVTRQEIQNYLANNRVQVNEVVLGRGQTLSPEAKRLADDANARMAEIYDEKMLPFFEQIVARGETLGGQEPYSVFSKLRGPLGRKAAKGDQEALAEIDALNLPPEIKDLVLEYGRNKNEYIKYTGQARKMEKPKFDKYNTPGGTNAREIYLTLPGKTVAPTPYTKSPATMLFERDMLEKYKADNFPSIYNRLSPNEVDRYEMLVREDRNAAKTESMLRDRQTNFTVPSAHSVSPEADRNRLAHIFLDDRTDAEGKKVLFVQEMQSDWAQKGRDKGFAKIYTPDQLKAEEVLPKPPGPPVWRVTYPDGNQSTFAAYTADEAIASAIQSETRMGAPPPAPFVSTQQYQVMKDGKPLVTKNKKDQEVPHIYSSPEDAQRAAERFGGTVKDIGMQENTEGWVNLALKRVINEAVENGYDKVAFIKGEQAADKYRLRTFVDDITADRSAFIPSNDLYVAITPKNSTSPYLFHVGEDGIIKEPISAAVRIDFLGQPLSDVVGKEVAKKLMSTKAGERQKLSNEGLSIGGEGMKGFYDNILPKTANKLLAKLGSKIEEVGIDNQPYLGFNITPEMIDMVKTQGLPQFAAGGEVTKFIKAHA